jgi:hypothetical protein
MHEGFQFKASQLAVNVKIMWVREQQLIQGGEKLGCTRDDENLIVPFN